MTDEQARQTRPVLATPSQILAEETLLEILEDAQLKRLQADLREQLAATPRGQSPAGAATLDEAISQWSNSLIMAEIANVLPQPSQIWVTDDTPREWLGHTLPGVGTSGDNPDAVYRIASVDGDRRFEVLGRFDPARRPAQLNIELHRGTKVTPPNMVNNTDLTPLASITDRDLQIAVDGSFRITIGPKEESPVHLLSAPGLLSLGSRDMLADWDQRPSWMELRPLDDVEPTPFDIAEIIRSVYRDLPGYLLFWANFPNVWFGGLHGNQISPGHIRTGSMSGFTVALSWDLRPDQAIVVTTDPVGAAYTGFQLMDPWMLGPNAKERQVSLNLAQTAPNPDGTFTFVIAHEDPGVANWLDTTGLDEGLGLIRWQAAPPGAAISPAVLVRDFRVVSLANVESLELPQVTPAQRAAQLAARAVGYHSRTL
ncbi:hypothetical protein Ga0074812_1406 [Parafrankia irregularis]|uniref:Uncharacterized protein n=1 Tax=Parafrankia irregularis TaxID=795642 RepID=A0A0S4QZ84_9ACTN|nr:MULTISPECIES: DUF1214 domain-containing protein [Parafrankia]MBE3203536.1 DUF1214 domain-containing protein [Parafrankia sp. CH37]CUU60430.1 hypothetical protein Ga0074812_1406 [Parafrankia irregularis]